MELLRRLPPVIVVLIHPVDTATHPTIPPGWRWAVQVGGGSPSDLDRCANAGWCPDERTARAEGEQNAVTALNAARMLGINATPRTLTIAYDPIPAGGDLVRQRPAPVLHTGTGVERES